MVNERSDISAVALLEERVRRALYEAVVRAPGPMSRDEAAAAVGVSRTLAAFHLDRLVAGGLLTPQYRRLSGRTGPGAGRPAKLYRRADREVAVTLPDRRYELAAKLFATTLDGSDAKGPPRRLRNAARDVGRSAGAEAGQVGQVAATGSGPQRVRGSIMAALREQGYEPCEAEDGGIRLSNCPFHALVAEHRHLVCGMNLALVSGIIDELGETDYTARPDPEPGRCCVAIERAISAGKQA